MHYVRCMSKTDVNIKMECGFVLHDHGLVNNRRENRNTNFVISGDGSAT